MNLVIKGQIFGGKNNMKISRYGHHYPNKKWAAWRDMVVSSLRSQKKADFKRFTGILAIELDYWKGDLRRRDVPAILDSIWHCLERAEIVEDDEQLANIVFTDKGLDRVNPRVEMQITKCP